MDGSNGPTLTLPRQPVHGDRLLSFTMLNDDASSSTFSFFLLIYFARAFFNCGIL
jgi:hypothetical protein